MRTSQERSVHAGPTVRRLDSRRLPWRESSCQYTKTKFGDEVPSKPSKRLPQIFLREPILANRAVVTSTLHVEVPFIAKSVTSTKMREHFVLERRGHSFLCTQSTHVTYRHSVAGHGILANS